MESDDHQQAIDNLISKLESQFPGLYLWVFNKKYSIHIGQITVPKEMQGQGIGTKVIQAIQDFSRSVNLPITLSPEAEPRKKAKLLSFYRSLGFVPNSGNKKDYRIASTFGQTYVWRP